ncbi:MAG TPA: hypothetical protein VFD16_03245 [Candidatus Saccharimonadales bacterium]|nr:hypothetical protein [Candidatus Saccharimonadales bacterium]
MANKIKDDLSKRLKEIQDNLGTNKELGIKKLEQLREEVKKSFDKAINSLNFKINIFKELKAQRENLRAWKISSLKTFFPLNFKYILSAPFIYGMIIPGLFFHISLEIYHQVCFRIYGIPRVKPSDYFIYNRRLLPYLNWIEKLNCLYCSYFNNLLQYAVEIAGRTERYWCPIKYAAQINQPHSQYPKFVDYLDAKNFREKWEDLRDFSDIKKTEAKNGDCENDKCDFIEKKKS